MIDINKQILRTSAIGLGCVGGAFGGSATGIIVGQFIYEKFGDKSDANLQIIYGASTGFIVGSVLGIKFIRGMLEKKI